MATPVAKPHATATVVSNSENPPPAAVVDSPSTGSEASSSLSSPSIVNLKGAPRIRLEEEAHPLAAANDKESIIKKEEKEEKQPKDALAMMAAVAMAELLGGRECGNVGKFKTEPSTEVRDDSINDSDVDTTKESAATDADSVPTPQKRKSREEEEVVAVSPETTITQLSAKRPRSSPSESPVRRMESRHPSPVSMMSTPHHRVLPPRGSPVHTFMRHEPPSMAYPHPGYRPSNAFPHYAMDQFHPSRSPPHYGHFGGASPPPHHMSQHLSGPIPIAPSSINCYEMATKTSGLPKALSFRKICSKCGKVRGEHGELGFGNKCVFQECGKCGVGKEAHDKANCPMGILCTVTVAEGAVPGASENYLRKIRDLASRAELQKTILEDKKKRAKKLAQMTQVKA